MQMIEYQAKVVCCVSFKHYEFVLTEFQGESMKLKAALSLCCWVSLSVKI